MRPYVDSLPLVIKIGAFSNLLKVLRRVLSRPKSIPMRPILSQVSSRRCFERNLKWRGCHAIWRRQVVDEFENVSQGTAIVLGAVLPEVVLSTARPGMK